MKSKKWFILILFFLVAVLLRFYKFKDTIYFGYDEARDAYISQAIYQQGDIKITGPAANGIAGLNHGVLHWYLIGLMYLAGSGSPVLVSAIFRLLNALAIFPIYWIAKKLFNERTALIATLLFAFSFEATQYAMYYGNPSLAVWSWIAIFAGAGVIIKEKNKFWGVPLMALGIATGAQLELFLVVLFPLSLIILLILKKYLKQITSSSWLLAFLAGFVITLPYFLGEIKNGFRSLQIIWKIFTDGQSTNSQSKIGVYFERWLLILHDNFWPIQSKYLIFIAVIMVIFWVYQSQKKIEYRILLAWIFGGALVFMFGAYNAYYINVGIGTGFIIGIAVFFDWLWNKNQYLVSFIIFLCLWGNLQQIWSRNGDSLTEDIKTQQFMVLSDELKVLDRIYQWSEGKMFTLRVTSMPYKVQTVWAYLFNHYGQEKYGYLPYYETGNTLGFPGSLPIPSSGSTCVRILLREPYGGIPMTLIQKDIAEEDLFSTIISTEEIGHFHLELRNSKDKNCRTNVSL